MEIYALLIALGMGAYAINSREQQRRIALLGNHLQDYRIEKLMETLSEGYMRALGESSPERREQIWELMKPNEAALSSQFSRFASQIARLDAGAVRVSRLPWSIPFAGHLFPGSMFDLREALGIHARGIACAVQNAGEKSAKERAYTLSAEMLLMQHTCHWYCKSRAIASARLMARHKSSHEQVVAAVSPETRRAYLDLIGG